MAAKKKFKIKAGDKVIVIAGKDKGKVGKVLKVLPEKERVIVEGVRIVKKHVRPSQTNPEGGIIEKEAPIHISNVMLVDPKTGEPTRVGIKFVDGKKVRYAKKSGEIIDEISKPQKAGR
ncbi:50S ribosomal protein L24 [Thermovibrio ammonificans]|uniref:Large ribosomal subunit protein uL24 n=1 Tax=Thermovibrio ammonificans (strain DSM 15698 / JCM 12110 / HB-1) TaxID=648996 RepID=E8T4A6_THEA1|nr:50S ribosomal protein L24 [Thermovibrio ammonificans]ADU96241.1 ribosomal protein L24 [Thermovibrio ammonificans HB-1]